MSSHPCSWALAAPRTLHWEQGEQQPLEIQLCSELSPAIVTNHAEICLYQQLVRSLNSNQQEKVTLAESAVRQGSSTKTYIGCYLNILNTLVPTEEGRKPKQDPALHLQFTLRLGCTQRSTPTPWLVFQPLELSLGTQQPLNCKQRRAFVQNTAARGGRTGSTILKPAVLSNTPISSPLQCEH